MTSTVIEIAFSPNEHIALDELTDNLKELIGSHNVHSAEPKAFAGLSEAIIILSIGGGVAIKEISSIIRSWIDRNKLKKVNLSKLEFSGYSAEEIRKILSQPE